MALRLPWPLPAALAWGLCWLVFLAGQRLGLPAAAALVVAALLGLLLSLAGSSWWRRLIIATGFPIALIASGAAAVPGWVWLVLLVLVLLVYPVKAWRDAPVFPTPVGALLGLAQQLPLPEQVLVLDAGCGLGHGLRALRAAYPLARLEGIEWSWPLRAWCGVRCPWARVRHGDIWRANWQPYGMVYLFQRPESMARAVAKARADMAAGAWMVSLEFEATGLHPDVELRLPDDRPVWAYQLPFRDRPAGAAVPQGA
jgi:hypothetical protein